MMKHLRTLLLILMCAVMVVLSACPAPTPPAPGSSTTSSSGSGSGSGSQPGSGSGNNGGDPTIPTGAVYRPSDTGERAAYWQKLSAPTGNFSTSAYTVVADGLTNESATPVAGTDLAYGFKTPYDGTYEIGADMLALAAANGEVTLTVYKNGAKIWPVTEAAYTATTENGTARFTATTAAKKDDLLYIRVSGNTTLNISPRVTLVSGNYSENRDIEKNFPTVGVLANAGATLTPSDAVMKEILTPAATDTYRASKIANIILTGEQDAKANKVYYVTNNEDVVLDFTNRNAYSYSCKGYGVCVVTEGKVTIKNCNVAISDLTIIAGEGVFIESSEGAKLTSVNIDGGLSIADTAKNIDLISCHVKANGTALENKSAAIGAVGCYFEGSSAALVDVSKGEGLYINCVFSAYHTAIDLSASSTTIRESTVYGDIVSGENVENLLVALCKVKGVGAITYEKVHNSVILFNEVENVSAKNSTNVYVCENAIYGGLLFDNVRYLIAEDNTLATADATLVSVRDYNGDNVTDVTARADNGVNEALLPHVNRDAHLMMTRKATVRDAERKNKIIGDYINENLKSNTDLIIAPGAYNSGNTVMKPSGIENANIYAYGVLFERTVLYGLGLDVSNCKNLGIYGMTISMNIQSSGQLQVLKKLGNGQVLCVVGAGVRPVWNKSHEIGYRENSLASYGDLVIDGTPTFDKTTGLATIKFNDIRYDAIEVGDVITCRVGDSLTRMQSSSGIFLEDITIMGGAIRCFWDDYNDKGTTINRALDTRMPAKIIDKATYDLYKQYENQYGVNTGVYIDEFGNYRGAESRSATADFAHANSNRTGFQVSNSIIDGLTDDGTNNQGHKSRVYGYDIETGKVLIKGDATWGYGEAISSAIVSGKAGDSIKIYTIAGEMIANTKLKSGITTAYEGDRYYAHFYIEPGNRDLADAIARIDTESDNSGDFKLLCECPETNSPNATFDNVLFQNIRSRACLIKGDGVRIENCSFINIGMAAIALNYEPKYSESGFPSDAVIRNNYFEGTGNYEDKKYYSPISVDAPAVQGGEDYMTSYNLLIEGNKIVDRYTSHALYVSGAVNVTIKNNDFGDRYDYEYTYAVYMDFVRDVELSGNTYSAVWENTAASGVACSNYVNVHGDDVDGVWNDRLVTDATYTTTWVENIPYYEGGSMIESFWTGGTLKFKGNWDAGYMSASSMRPETFKRFNSAQGGGPMFFSYSNGAWSGIGAVSSIARDYRFITAANNNPAIRYTMDKNATVAISIAEFFPPYPQAEGMGVGDGLFAIFVNDKMVWPTENGDYNNRNDWYLITQTSTVADINKSLESLTLELSEGDQIFFMAKQYSADYSMFAATPNVYYLG